MYKGNTRRIKKTSSAPKGSKRGRSQGGIEIQQAYQYNKEKTADTAEIPEVGRGRKGEQRV